MHTSDMMNKGAFPELMSERLDLCEITRDHVGWYLEHFSIPEIAIGQGFPPPRDIEAAKEELDRYIVGLFEEGNGYRWGIRLKGQEEIIGSVGFYAWDKDENRAKMGYDLRPTHWRKGIMKEALGRALGFGFENMGLNRIEVTIMATNLRSIGLVTRLGFTREGILREFSKQEGKYVDEHVFSILKRDWRAGQSRPVVVQNLVP